jgi:hypothetical protein
VAGRRPAGAGGGGKTRLAPKAKFNPVFFQATFSNFEKFWRARFSEKINSLFP